MSNNVWKGDSPAIAQVNTVTPANVGIGNTFTLTINGKSITFTATAATVANVTAGLAALVAATTIPEFLEVTAADNTTNVTLTANTPGVPFTQTSSASGGSATLSTSTTIANSGPHVWDVALNWSAGTIPVSTEDVYIEHSGSDILYGLGQAAVALNSLNISSTFTGKIGLPLVNANGYVEYRSRYLAIQTTTLTVGRGDGDGSSRMKIDLGDHTTTIQVDSTGSPEAVDYPALEIKGGGTNTLTITILKGSVGMGLEPGDTTKATLTIGEHGAGDADATFIAGNAVTITAVTQYSGTVTLPVVIVSGTYTMTGGKATWVNKMPVGNITIAHGTVTLIGALSATYANTLTLGPGGVFDCTDLASGTLSTNAIVLHSGASFIDPNKAIAASTGMSLQKCRLADVTLDVGFGRTIVVS